MLAPTALEATRTTQAPSTMASYSTIPAADVETEQPLLKRDVKLNVIVRGALHDDLELVRREAHQTQIQSTKEAAHDDEARRDEEEPPGRRHGCCQC